MLMINIGTEKKAIGITMVLSFFIAITLKEDSCLLEYAHNDKEDGHYPTICPCCMHAHNMPLNDDKHC